MRSPSQSYIYVFSLSYFDCLGLKIVSAFQYWLKYVLIAQNVLRNLYFSRLQQLVIDEIDSLIIFIITMSEEASSPTHSKLKQMRRIPEKTEAPADKSELIQYLSSRIKQAQDALNDTEELLQSEVKERQKISLMIEQRNAQLEKLYQVDQRGLPEKIKQKLSEILTTTISQKVDAEENLAGEKGRNYQFKQMYEELKWEQKNITHKLNEQTAKENAINSEIAAIEGRNAQHEQDLKELEADYSQMKDKKERLQNRYLQMKVALDRMNDVKAVLNRFFGNEDLFDEKMDLKEQRVQRVEVVSRENQNRTTVKETTKNQTKLKPLNYTNKNDDEDFWRGEFTKNKN